MHLARLLALACGAAALLACGARPPAAPAPTDLWRHVPADAIVAIGTTQPMGPRGIDMLLTLLDSAFEGAGQGFTEGVEEAGANVLDPEVAPTHAALLQVKDALTHERLASMGIAPGHHVVAYVDARAFVIRVGLAEPDRTRAWLDDLASGAEALDPVEATTLDGRRMWQSHHEGVWSGAVVEGDQWIIVVGGADDAPAVLRRALGPPPAAAFEPGQVLAADPSSKLPTQLVAHVDLPALLVRVTSFFPDIAAPPCSTEITWLARTLPRWRIRVTADDHTFHETHALQWPDDIAARLAPLASGLAYPATGPTHRGTLALNVQAGWQLLADGLAALTSRRFECPALAELPGQAGMAALGLSQVVPEEVLALRGIDFELAEGIVTIRTHLADGGARAFSQRAGLFVAPPSEPGGWGALVSPLVLPQMTLAHAHLTPDTLTLASSAGRPPPAPPARTPGVLGCMHGPIGAPKGPYAKDGAMAAFAWSLADPPEFYRDAYAERWLRVAPTGLEFTNTIRSKGERPLIYTAATQAAVRDRRAQLSALCRAPDDARGLPLRVPTARVPVPGAGAVVPPLSLAIANDGVRLASSPDDRPDTWPTTLKTLDDMVRTALADDRKPDLTVVPAPDLPLPALRIALAGVRKVGFVYVVLVARGAPAVEPPGPAIPADAAPGPYLDAALGALDGRCAAAARGVRQLLGGLDCSETLTPIAQTVALCPLPAETVDRAVGAALALGAPTITVALDLRHDLPAPLQGEGTWADAAAALFAPEPKE
ncbi:MAG: hypothetical protein H6704_30080 [Myxococcales bacterium]|nr:hypothetical protein [Myxococcales bacterium]